MADPDPIIPPVVAPAASVGPVVAPVIHATPENHPRKKKQAFAVIIGLVLFALVIVGLAAAALGPSWMAIWGYKPEEGDLVFQSSMADEFVAPLEKATKSPLTGVGIVGKDPNGKWVVYEAYKEVEATPLSSFLGRGKNSGFAVYRWKAAEAANVQGMLKYVRDQLGKPLDMRYDWNDTEFYSAELLYKAYASATNGGELCKKIPLEGKKWADFRKVIAEEGRTVPETHEIVTVKDIAESGKMDLVTKFAIEAK